MGKMLVRRARMADVVKFTRWYIPRKIIGFAGEVEGKCVCVSVAVWDNAGRVWLTFSGGPDTLKEFRFTIHKAAIVLVSTILEVCPDLRCLEEKGNPRASVWLERLGFHPTGESLGEENIWIKHGTYSTTPSTLRHGRGG